MAGLLLAAVVAGASACTHLTPYYRDGPPRPVAPAAESAIDHRLLLIGDAGDPTDGEPVLELLKRRVARMPDRTTVVFLGDNAYERGMPEAPRDPGEEAADAAKDIVDAVFVDLFASRQEAERAVNAQIDVVRGTAARGIFLPGNHDWDQFEEKGGWDRILEQGRFIDAAAGDGVTDVRMLPRGGCPGPSPIALGTRGELIALDTQWWLETRIDGKPVPDRNPTNCDHTTEKAVREALVAQLEGAARRRRWSVVVGHHPLESEGPHGGYIDPIAHVFPFRIVRHYVPFYVSWLPLPVIGSAVVGLRGCCSPSAQDMSNGRNLHMRNAVGFSLLEAEKSGAAPLVYAAGHDHSLQVFEGRKGARYLLVSGLGSHTHASEVGSNERTLFAHSNPAHAGFMQIDFLDDGRVRLAVIECDGDAPEGAEVYSRELTGAEDRTDATDRSDRSDPQPGTARAARRRRLITRLTPKTTNAASAITPESATQGQADSAPSTTRTCRPRTATAALSSNTSAVRRRSLHSRAPANSGMTRSATPMIICVRKPSTKAWRAKSASSGWGWRPRKRVRLDAAGPRQSATTSQP